MKSFTSVLPKALALTGTLAALSPVSQAVTFFDFGGHRYGLTTAATSVGDARAEALSLGGDLVSINDPAEEAFLESTFGGTTEPFWIGLFEPQAGFGAIGRGTTAIRPPISNGVQASLAIPLRPGGSKM
jgi:hypothetical protein